MYRELYIDESGNTGSALYTNGKFNFVEQPYYVLAAILLDSEMKNKLLVFVDNLKKQYKISGTELKSSKLYGNKDLFINELIDYIVAEKIPVFIELMDKKYYININIFEVIAPSNMLQLETISEKYFEMSRDITTLLYEKFDDSIYAAFSKVLNDYNNNSLENFYKLLINKFQAISDLKFLSKIIEDTEKSYFKTKLKDSKNAFKYFLPEPDLNINENPIFLLPNYNSFTNIISRSNKFCEDAGVQLSNIVHDEQKQYDTIFKDIFNKMKQIDYGTYAPKFVNKKINTYIPKNVNLLFRDSKSNIPIQVVDIIAGTVNRWWSDFINLNSRCIKYLNFIYRLNGNINLVIPNQHHYMMEKLMLKINDYK